MNLKVCIPSLETIIKETTSLWLRLLPLPLRSIGYIRLFSSRIRCVTFSKNRYKFVLRNRRFTKWTQFRFALMFKPLINTRPTIQMSTHSDNRLFNPLQTNMTLKLTIKLLLRLLFLILIRWFRLFFTLFFFLFLRLVLLSRLRSFRIIIALALLLPIPLLLIRNRLVLLNPTIKLWTRKINSLPLKSTTFWSRIRVSITINH